jgi:hypothetical protein
VYVTRAQWQPTRRYARERQESLRQVRLLWRARRTDGLGDDAQDCGAGALLRELHRLQGFVGLELQAMQHAAQLV